MKPALVLMVIGGAIILAAVISAGFTYEHDKQRVAEFYQKNGNAPSVTIFGKEWYTLVERELGLGRG